MSERQKPGAAAEERRRFVCPPPRGQFEEIELSLLDPADPDDRRFLIEAEHPELVRALEEDRDEIVLHGQRMSPRLHLTLHEIVANQLWDDDPPEAWRTARRLLDLGYERHEILHMLCSAMATEVWAVLHEGRSAEPERYLRALEELPGSWEARR